MKDEEFGIIDWKLTTPDGEIIAGGKGGRVGTDLSGPPPSPIIQIIKVKYEGREYINERASDGMHYVNIAPTFELIALCEDGSLWQGLFTYADRKMTWLQISPPQESATWTENEQVATGGVSWLDMAGPVILGILMIVLSCIGVISVIKWVTNF